MQTLHVSLIQTHIHWENSELNRKHIERHIDQIKQPTDVIILPEMFPTGYTTNTTQAEISEGPTTQWMKHLAQKTNTLILGSVMTRTENRYYNRLIWMSPEGTFKIYDKRHLFRMAKEDHTFSAGDERLIATYKGWRICPLICYDLRFPVWSRNHWDQSTQKMSYDLLIYVANWPKARIAAWDTLLRARALENLCYTVGVNRVGIDGKDIKYNGHTSAIDPRGQVLFFAPDTEIVTTIALQKKTLSSFWKKFPAYLDADKFTLSEREHKN